MNKQMKKKRALLPAVFVFAVFLWPLKGEEVQAHGVSFEKWVRDSFFNGYTGDYTHCYGRVCQFRHGLRDKVQRHGEKSNPK